MRKVVLLAVLGVVAGCAPKPLPAPVVTAPKFPDFTPPVVPASLAGSPAALGHARGWRLLQAGDLRGAEREFDAALKASPAFYPAEDGLAYVAVARKELEAALPHFDRALERQPADLSALLGKAQALVSLGRDNDALPVLEAALRVDPSLSDVARRVEVLRLRGQQDDVNRARQAARAGRLDEAEALYRQALEASPDSAFLYRELAAIERRMNEADQALAHLRQAAALEPPDARTLTQIGEILESRGNLEGAIKAYADAVAADSSPDLEARLGDLRARAELARLPEEYRAIEQAPQTTRGDLAALVGIRLAGLLRLTPARGAVLITDIRNHWASPWIVAVAEAGVMEPFANHGFQPQTVVKRIDLAQVVSRLLARVAAATPGQPHPWQTRRVRFSDLTTGHLAYPAASASVAAGVLTAGPGNTFQPARVVSGQEAIAAIEAIEAMAGTLPPRGTSAK